MAYLSHGTLTIIHKKNLPKKLWLREHPFGDLDQKNMITFVKLPRPQYRKTSYFFCITWISMPSYLADMPQNSIRAKICA